ncbi:hypothetical protein L204_103785 [Cryptococcus depauperatus]
MNTSTQRPIVAVIGTTGVGKSQLAISLAQSLASTSTTNPLSSHLNSTRTEAFVGGYPAIVLSADSMQLYKGLDVITNKVTKEEMGGVEHWGLDIVRPGQDRSWEVGKWCTEADKKISTLTESVLPIICGGTHYFIQHFLFPPPELSLERTEESHNTDSLAIRWTPPGPRPVVPPDLSPKLDALLNSFWLPKPIWPFVANVSSLSSDEDVAGTFGKSRSTDREDDHLLSLFHLLEAVDPQEAKRWHWRDGRKVRRSLERWWERGGPVPREKERKDDSVNQKGRRARFRTLIFWVYEPLETLRPRLDARVDRMVENGLLREISELRDIARKACGTSDAIDHTEGIFQSIGYKEFSALPLPQYDPQSHPLYQVMLERTKVSTHQYAKSQLKWIKKQILPTVREARSLGGKVEVYVVPSGRAGVTPAIDILQKFLRNGALPQSYEVGCDDAQSLLECLERGTKVPNTADRQDINARRDCKICSTPEQPYSVLQREWAQHIKTRQHKRFANANEIDKATWIAAQKAKGESKRAERERLKQLLKIDEAGKPRLEA